MVATGIATVGAWYLPIPPRGLVLPPPGGWTAPVEGVFALAHALVVGTAGIGAGGWVLLLAARLGEVPASTHRAERMALSFLLGLPLVATFLWWWGLGDGALIGRTGVLFGAPLVLLAAGVWGCVSALREWRSHPAGREFDASAWVAACVVGLVLAQVFWVAMGPAVESDGLRYHLVGPQEWHRAGAFVYLPYNAFSNLPSQLGLLCAWAPHGVRGSMFQVLHALHAVAAVVLAAGLARRLAAPAPGQTAAIGAALLMLAIPAIAIVAAWPFSDVAALAYTLAAIRMLPAFGEEAPPAEASHGGDWAARGLLIGLALGGAVASKLSAGPIVLVVAVEAMVAIARRGGAGAVLRAGLLMTTAGTLVVGPWLIKNTLLTGNPIYPGAWGVLGGGEWSAANGALYAEKAGLKGFGKGVWDFLRSPDRVQFLWPAFEAHHPGPAMLASMLLAAGAMARGGWREGRWRVLARLVVVAWVLWFVGYQSVRFLMLPLVLLAVMVGAAVARGVTRRAAAVALASAMATPGILWSMQWWWMSSQPPAALGAVADRPAFITRKFSSYPAVAWLNREGAQRRVRALYIGEHRAAYATGFEPVWSDWFDTPRVVACLESARDAQEVLMLLERAGITHVLVNEGELKLYVGPDWSRRMSPGAFERLLELLPLLRSRAVFRDPELYVAELGGGGNN